MFLFYKETMAGKGKAIALKTDSVGTINTFLHLNRMCVKVKKCGIVKKEV